MAKEKKQRGRRSEKTHKDVDEEEEYHDKVYSNHDNYTQQDVEMSNTNEKEDDYKYATGSNAFNYEDNSNSNEDAGYSGRDEDAGNAFFGLLDEQETEYFKQAESTLSVDAFGSPEERRGFVISVFEETKGKELKLVTSYVGSRLCERLVLLANDAQLVGLLNALAGNYAQLVKNKFASHVVETLLTRAASLIEREMLDPQFLENLESTTADENGDSNTTASVFGHVQRATSIEQMLLNMIDEIKPVVTSLPEHPYASHFLRLLLLVLAGKPIPAATEAKSSLRSRRSKDARKKIILSGTQTLDDTSKSSNAGNDTNKEEENTNNDERTYQVPRSFSPALDEILAALLKGLDTASAREMSIHAVSSPVVQLILGIECDRIADSNPNPQKIKIPTYTFLSVLFPYSTNRQKKLAKEHEDESKLDENEKAEAKKREESYVEYLLSDAIGSHLLEAVIDILPVKLTARLADRYMVGRIGKLVRRQQSGNYVVQALLKRMSGRKDIASKIMDELIEEIRNGNLVEQSEMSEKEKLNSFNFGLARTIIEVSQQSLNGYKCDEVVETIINKYDPKKEGLILTNMLNLGSTNVSKEDKTGHTINNGSSLEYDGAKMQKALLLQTLISVSPSTTNLILENLIKFGDTDKNIYLLLGRDSILSHVFEKALVVTTDSQNMILRRRLLNYLSKPEVCCELAANVYGSHVVDAMFQFCFRLKFFRERVADELVKKQSEIKMTGYGKSVWKNWKLDEYMRRRRDWWNKVKVQEDDISEKLGMEKKDSRNQGPKVFNNFKKDMTKKDSKSGKTKREPFAKQKREKAY